MDIPEEPCVRSVYVSFIHCELPTLGNVPWTMRRSNLSLLKEISPEIFIGRTDAEAETPILWKKWLIGKDPDAGKDWSQGKKETTEDKMVGWHHRLDGITGWMASPFGWTWVWASSGRWWRTEKPGVLCSSWGRKESDMTERLKNCCSHVFRETDSLRRTMHIRSAVYYTSGPKKSLLLAKDPDQFLWKPYRP